MTSEDKSFKFLGVGKRLGISPFLVAKRDRGYRTAKTIELQSVKCCKHCKHKTDVKFPDMKERTQCLHIGVSVDVLADIEAEFICRHFKR
jgi:hypothetical protein